MSHGLTFKQGLMQAHSLSVDVQYQNWLIQLEETHD
jgi:hypothetical protein